jgi:hypothetical protein
MGLVVLYACTSNMPISIHLSKHICPCIDPQYRREFWIANQNGRTKHKKKVGKGSSYADTTLNKCHQILEGNGKNKSPKYKNSTT